MYHICNVNSCFICHAAWSAWPHLATRGPGSVLHINLQPTLMSFSQTFKQVCSCPLTAGRCLHIHHGSKILRRLKSTSLQDRFWRNNNQINRPYVYMWPNDPPENLIEMKRLFMCIAQTDQSWSSEKNPVEFYLCSPYNNSQGQLYKNQDVDLDP